MASQRVNYQNFYRISVDKNKGWVRKRVPSTRTAAAPADASADKPATPPVADTATLPVAAAVPAPDAQIATAAPAPEAPAAENTTQPAAETTATPAPPAPPDAPPTPAPEVTVPPPQAPKPVADEFTAEQDARLLELKLKENKTWNEIATALQKTKGGVQSRFKQFKAELDKATAAAAATTPNAAAPSGAAAGGAGIGAGGGVQAEGRGRDNRSTRPGSVAAGSAVVEGVEQARYVYIDEDEQFDPAECEMLARLHVQDADELFGRIASRFYDNTGRRITAAEVASKLGIS